MTAIKPATLVSTLTPINEALGDARTLLKSVLNRIEPYRIEMQGFYDDVPKVVLLHPDDQSAALDDAVEAAHLLTVASAKIEGAFGPGTWMQEAVDSQRQWTDHASQLLRKPSAEVSADEVSAALGEAAFDLGEAATGLRNLEMAADTLTQSGTALAGARETAFSAPRAAKLAESYGTGSDYVAKYGGTEIASEPIGIKGLERSSRW